MNINYFTWEFGGNKEFTHIIAFQRAPVVNYKNQKTI
jgi:hypothetical protein